MVQSAFVRALRRYAAQDRRSFRRDGECRPGKGRRQEQRQGRERAADANARRIWRSRSAAADRQACSRHVRGDRAMPNIRRAFTGRRTNFLPSMPYAPTTHCAPRIIPGLGFVNEPLRQAGTGRSSAAVARPRFPSLHRRRACFALARRRPAASLSAAPPRRSASSVLPSGLSPSSLRADPKARSAALAKRSPFGSEHAARLCRQRRSGSR